MGRVVLKQTRPAFTYAPARRAPAAVLMRYVSKSYQSGSDVLTVFESVNLEVREGEFVAAVGPIGSGKTTLLNLIAELERPDAGVIYIHGIEITALSGGQLTEFRARKFGIVPQVQNLVPQLTVRENVELPLFFRGVKRADRERLATVTLERLGVAGAAQRSVATLSVGEKQMVAVARALVADPPILLMDEPTECLDPLMSDLLLSFLRGDNMLRGKTIFVATHDRKVMELAHKIIHMKKRIP